MAPGHPSADRRVFLRSVAGAAALLAAACSKPSTKPELTAPEIIQQSGDKLKTVKDLHFVLTADNGTMVIGGLLPASKVEGDAAQPDKLSGTATGTIGQVTIELSVVIIGNKMWITNPASKQWQAVPNGATGPNLLDPDHGAASVVQQAQNPQKLADETIEGTACYHVQGSLDSGLIAALLGSQGNGQRLQGEIWAGKDDLLIRQIRLKGPVVANEKPDIVRTLVLSKFNAGVNIQPPI